MERPLSELDPRLDALRHEKGEAFGLWFDCPACGKHSIFVPFDGVSPYEAGLWRCTDRNLATISLSPSVDLSKPSKDPKTGADVASSCSFHGVIQNGIVNW